MMKIIYSNTAGMAVICPAPCGLSIQQIAAKDVPYGLPYLFVDDDMIPEGAPLEALEADLSAPDGYGLGAHRWFIQQADSAIAGIRSEVEEAQASRADLVAAVQTAGEALEEAADQLAARQDALAAAEEGADASGAQAALSAAETHHQNCTAMQALAAQCLAAVDMVIQHAETEIQQHQATRQMLSDELFKLEGVRL